jgi:plasmid segregation protein ParM
MIPIIPVDLGFGWTKGKNGTEIWCQPSIIGEAKQLFDENKKEGDVIYNSEYFVGRVALKHSEVKYFSINDNKAETWITEILFKSMLGYLEPNKSSYVVTGLPIDFYFNQKTTMQDMIRRINDDDFFELEIVKVSKQLVKPIIRNSKIVPQPLGTAMDHLLDDRGKIRRMEEAKSRILVVDIGFYTLDLLILDGMEIDKASCSPPGLGVNIAYKLLQGYLKEKIGKAPANYDMDQCVIEKEYEGYDITPLIRKAFRVLAIQIQNEIESLNIGFHRVLLTGGAAPLIFEFLQLNNMITLPSPQLANIRGYEKIGRRLWEGR